MTTSTFADPPTVLVIGAGMAGLACARTLTDAGLEVVMVDKGRGPGGRLATRRHDDHHFDHGAQFFTARDSRFRQLVEAWHHAGVVAPWKGRIVTLEGGAPRPARSSIRWVGTPKMSSLSSHLADGLEIRRGQRALSVSSTAAGWRAELENGESLEANLCVLTAPAPQSMALIADALPLALGLDSIELAPCIAFMVSFREPLEIEFDAAFIDDSPLSWIARDSSKPDRAPGERWVLHATPAWSLRHLEDEPEALGQAFLTALSRAITQRLPECEWLKVHSWRYARVTQSIGVDHVFDHDYGIGYAGDGCLGSRIEQAFLSGVAVADSILHRLVAGAHIPRQ